MEHIRKVASMCVARAVGFGALAIFCVMFSFSFNPVAAFRAGAILTLLMSVILLWKAVMSPRQKPYHTETWIYLDKSLRPVDDLSRRVYAEILTGVYAQFARWCLLIACAFFVLSLLLLALGFENFQPERVIRPRLAS